MQDIKANIKSLESTLKAKIKSLQLTSQKRQSDIEKLKSNIESLESLESLEYDSCKSFQSFKSLEIFQSFESFGLIESIESFEKYLSYLHLLADSHGNHITYLSQRLDTFNIRFLKRSISTQSTSCNFTLQILCDFF